MTGFIRDRFKHLFLVFIPALCVPVLAMPDPPGQAGNSTPVNEAYLFAHMVHEDYWRLYYSVSLDGLHWTMLNDGKRVFDDYRGHADICKGHDGRYYLVGNRRDSSPDINFWVSDDLITWQFYSKVTPELKKTPNYTNAMPRIGCPSCFSIRSQSSMS